MAIPEAKLDTWAQQGAVAGSRDTYAAIKRVLEESGAPFAIRRPRVFLQGSYGNDTNVWSESDVDIVVRMDSVFYYDIDALIEADQLEFKKGHPPAEYKLQDFKADVTGWLADNFGVDVHPGNKAVEIAARNNRRKADVLISSMYRRYYYAGPMNVQEVEGVKFLTGGGQWIVNYPQLHSENLTAKHQATRGWLKPTIRVFKNMRNRMIAEGMIEKGIAPSYFIEGLLYNVPYEQFGLSYANTVTNCVNWLWNANRTTFICVNGRQILLGDNSLTSWPARNCTAYLGSVIQLWNER